MPPSDCQVCRQFIEEAALSMKVHLETMADIAATVQKDNAEQELLALEETLEACRLRREEAVAAYENHLAVHAL